MTKKLESITISHTPGQVGISFSFDDAPAQHFLLTVADAKALREKLDAGIALASLPRGTAEHVSVSEYVNVSIQPPKEH